MLSQTRAAYANNAALLVVLQHRGFRLGLSRMVSMGAQMAGQIAVGALAGPAAIGTLQLHMAWSAVFGEVVGQGEPTRAMRESAVANIRSTDESVALIMRRATKKIFCASVILLTLALGLFVSGETAQLDTGDYVLALSIVLAAPLLALTRVCAETLKSLDHPLLAVSLENMAIPFALLTACGTLFVINTNDDTVTSSLLVAAVLGALLGAAFLRTSLRRIVGKPRHQGNTVTSSAPTAVDNEWLYFWLTGLMNIAFLQLPFLIMPWLVSASEVGKFAVAHKLVNVITTFLILLTAVYGPRFARATASGQFRDARRQLRETQYLSIALFVPVWALLLTFADNLSSMFNLGTDELTPFLLILGAGQFINAATGLSGVMLNMSGAARLETRLLLITMLATALSAVLMGTRWGSIGITIAISGGIALRTVSSYVLASRHLKQQEIRTL